MKIVLTGAKGSGKTEVGRLLAERIDVPHFDTDGILEGLYAAENGSELTCREICRQEGEKAFRALEARAAEAVAEKDWCLVSTGGGTLLNSDSRALLRRDAILVLLRAPAQTLWERIREGGVPSYLDAEDPQADFARRVERTYDVLEPYADVLVDTDALALDAVVERVHEAICEELTIRMQSPSTIGQVLRLTTFGESHGKGIGAVLDGVPPGLELSEEDIQAELDRRRPGQSAVSTPRNETDKVRILSGVFEGRTTGCSIGLLVPNRDQDSSKYYEIQHLFRPGHADFTYWRKYGLRDFRGGGRSSGRETAARTAGGAVARKILAERGVKILAWAQEIAGIACETVDPSVIEANPVRAADPTAAKRMEQAILDAKAEEDSVGGIVQIVISGVPAGLGDPVFGKLDARLAGGLMSIGATKGIEFGTGFAAARMRGSEHNDAMQDGKFLTNNAGGIYGGISNGEEIRIRVVVKPTASIGRPQQACDLQGRSQRLVVEGRHDPCIIPRVIPVMESMCALVLLDAWQIQQRLRGDWPLPWPPADN